MANVDLIESIYTLICNFRPQKIFISKIPVHKGFIGNKYDDQLAKKYRQYKLYKDRIDQINREIAMRTYNSIAPSEQRNPDSGFVLNNFYKLI